MFQLLKLQKHNCTLHKMSEITEYPDLIINEMLPHSHVFSRLGETFWELKGC